MRVLYLTMNPNRVSTTMPTEGWFRLLRSRGLEPLLVSHRAGAFHEWAVEQGIPAHEVPLPFPSKLWPWPFLRSLWQLRTIVKRHAIELIHCNEQDIYPIGQHLGRLCGLPVVVSVHFTMERGYCTWAFGGRKAPARLIFTSKGNREACRPGVEGVVPEESWRLLYNGLDLNHFRPDPARGAAFRVEHGLGDGLLIGTACAFRPRKQLEHLFAAAARVPVGKVVLAGGGVAGDERYVENLLREGRQLLGDRLVHVGHLNELRGLYNALDLYLNASREEACSLSIIESLACGCPVLSYPSTSVDEQILPGGGEIVTQDSIDELAAALRRRLADPDALRDARGGARGRAEQVFDLKHVADQLWSEYHDVLSARGLSERRDSSGRAVPCRS